MTADALSPRQRLLEIIRKGEEKIDLAEAALVIARDEFPLLDIKPYLAQIEDLSSKVMKLLPSRSEPSTCLGALNQVLFEEEGFAGNQEEYYDPRNSFLNEVLDRRTGIPITLSLLYMEVARRAKLPVVGVGLPGHFIAAFRYDGKSHYVDPFHQGRFLTEEECKEKVQKMHKGRVHFKKDYLRPVKPFALLSRLLNNLKTLYVESKSHAKAYAVIDKLVLLNPGRWEEVRDRGLMLYHINNFNAALGDLETYLKNTPDAEDRQDLLKLAELIGKRLQKKE